MALTKEDGTSVEDANTYNDISDLDAYFALTGRDVTVWSAASTAEKEAAAIIATQYLEGRFGSRYIGYKRDRPQGLEWPRGEAYDPNGWLFANNKVPREITDAHAELSFREFSGTLLADNVTGNVKKTSDQVGPLKTSVEYQTGSAGDSNPMYGMVELILRRVLSSVASVDLIRA